MTGPDQRDPWREQGPLHEESWREQEERAEAERDYRPCAGCDAVSDSCRSAACPAAAEDAS